MENQEPKKKRIGLKIFLGILGLFILILVIIPGEKPGDWYKTFAKPGITNDKWFSLDDTEKVSTAASFLLKIRSKYPSDDAIAKTAAPRWRYLSNIDSLKIIAKATVKYIDAAVLTSQLKEDDSTIDVMYQVENTAAAAMMLNKAHQR